MTSNISDSNSYGTALNRYQQIAEYTTKLKASIEAKTPTVDVDQWERSAMQDKNPTNNQSADHDALNKAVVARETAEKEMKAYISELNTNIDKSPNKIYGGVTKDKVSVMEQSLTDVKQAVKEQVENPLKALKSTDSNNPKTELQAKRTALAAEIQEALKGRSITQEMVASDPAFKRLAQMDKTLAYYDGVQSSVSKLAQLKPAQLSELNKALENPLDNLHNGQAFNNALAQVNSHSNAGGVTANNFANAATGNMAAKSSLSDTLASTGGTAHLAYKGNEGIYKVWNKSDGSQFMAIPKAGLKNVKRDGDKVMAYYDNGTVTEYKQDLIKDKDGKTTHVQTQARQMMKDKKGNYIANPDQMPMVYTAAAGKKGRETGVVITSAKMESLPNGAAGPVDTRTKGVTALANIKTKGSDATVASGNLGVQVDKSDYQLAKTNETGGTWVRNDGKSDNPNWTETESKGGIHRLWDATASMFDRKWVPASQSGTINDPSSLVAKASKAGTSNVAKASSAEVKQVTPTVTAPTEDMKTAYANSGK